MKIPLCIYRVNDQLQIDEVRNEDLVGGSHWNDGVAGTAVSRASTEAMQALLVRSSRAEQQMNNMQLTLQASISKQKTFFDSRLRILNNNVRAVWGTIDGGLALQNSGGRMLRLNDPTLLEEIVQPAHLSKKPMSLLMLWKEYKIGLDGNKPAEHFTMAERSDCRGGTKQKYYQRKHVWHLIEKLMSNGFSAKVAIDKIHQAYGYSITVTEIIGKIVGDKTVEATQI